MSVAGVPNWSLRLERAESSRLAWAFGISTALHLLLLGLFLLVNTANRNHWWDRLPPWLKPAQKLVEALKKKETPPPKEQEVPLVFIEVDPAQAVAEPPKNAQYYSSLNAKAANPEPDKGLPVPQINGLKPEVARTEDAPRSQFVPLQPTPPPPAPAPKTPEAQPEAKPKPKPPPGDLAMAKPELTLKPDEGQQTNSRPRTIEEALARLPPSSRLAGQKMKQEGGTHQRSLVPSFDTKATLYGEYDYAFIHAVEQRWFALLDQWNFASDSRGKVVLHFELHSDGRITNMEVTENTAGEVLGLICQKAVLDPAPFERWTKEMRLNLDDPRKIQFAFYYY